MKGCPIRPPITRVPILGLGKNRRNWGWVLLGPMGLVVPRQVPQAIRPSKEADGGAAQCSNRTTSPRFQLFSPMQLLCFSRLRRMRIGKEKERKSPPLGRRWDSARRRARTGAEPDRVGGAHYYSRCRPFRRRGAASSRRFSAASSRRFCPRPAGSAF